MREPDEHVTTNLTIEPRDPRSRRRRITVAAAVGISAALGAGLLITQNSDARYPAEPAAQNGGPLATAAGTPAAPSASAGASGLSAPVTSAPPKVSPTPSPRRTPKPAVTSYRVGATTPEPLAVAADVPVRERTTREGNSTLKVVSALGDLSYQREMLWRADEGTAVGQVRCTNNIKVNFNSPAKVRPTMLLCWRLTDSRSAYTLAVDPDGKPVQSASVTALNAAWAALG